MSNHTPIGWMFLLAALGCAGSPAPLATPPKASLVTARITDQNYASTKRTLAATQPQNAEYARLRAGLVRYLTDQTQEVVGSGDYSALIAHFEAITRLFTPAEIADGNLPEGLHPICEAVVEQGSPRADEGAVLAALLVLDKLHPETAEYGSYYERLKEWSTSAREVLPDPMGFEDELIQVWSRHAQLAPIPEVLENLARRHAEERLRFMHRFEMTEGRFPFTTRDIEHVHSKSYAISGVFLRHGNVAAALSHLRSAGATGSLDARLIELLEQALDPGQDGADALLALAAAPGFRRGEAEVSVALCQLGQRSYPDDPRFPACLGNLAALRDDPEAVVAQYTAATAMAPDDHNLADAYLYDLYGLLTASEPSAAAGRMTLIAEQLLATLNERLRRWPDSAPPVSVAKLYLALALSEMNAGQTEQAEQHLADSLKIEEDAAAHLHLGNLLARMGEAERAADHYEAALKQTDEGEPVQRAELFERLGDAQRIAEQTKAANASYSSSLALWSEVLAHVQGPQAGIAEVRRGVLYDRLGERDKAHDAFDRALIQAPGFAETYKGILSHLVISDPDEALANRVFRHAQRQVRLDPEWKVYLALWVQIVAGRSSGDPLATEKDAEEVLRDFAGTNTWWAKLASFGAGKTSYNALLEQASDPGQRAEAMFYEGARRLRRGDWAGAHAHFQQVLDTRMVNFYEFIMAQELLRVGTTGPVDNRSHLATSPTAAAVAK